MHLPAWRFGAAGLTALCLFLLIGCGDGGATVSGSVTYDGKPVEHGVVSFLPVGAAGRSEGAPIRNGQYQISGVAPGQHRVVINGSREIGKSYSSEEALRMKATYKVEGNVPDDAIGNGETVEIAPGFQTRDFELKKPPEKAGTPKGRQKAMPPEEFLRKGRPKQQQPPPEPQS